MMKKIIRFVLSPVFLASIIFLSLQLPVFNLGISYRDEGFFSYSAIRINKGELPYRDFFLTTTPGTYYLTAFLFKIFGNQLIVGRFLYLFLSLFIIFLANKIFRLEKPWNWWYLFSLSLALVWPGGFAFYNTEAIVAVITSFYFLKKGLDKERMLHLVFSGLAAAAAYFFKQTVGIFTLISFLTIIALYADKNRLIKAVIFFAFAALPVFCYLVYLLLNGAFTQFFYYTTVFAKVVKAHRLPFLIQRLVFIPLFLLFFKFIFNLKNEKKNKVFLIFLALLFIFTAYLAFFPERLNALINHLADQLFYFYSFAFFFPLIILSFPFKNKTKTNELRIYSILSLGVFLALGSSGYEIGAIKTLTFFIVPLFINFVLLYAQTFRLSHFLAELLISLFIISYTLFVFSNPYLTKTKIFGVYPKKGLTETLNLPETKYIKVSPEEKKDLTEVVSYIKSHTSNDEKIFCFPYCPMLFVLAQRGNISYYSMFYFETFLSNDQQFAMEEIITKKPTLILVQKKGYLENEADFEDKRLSRLKDFLFQNNEVSLENNNFVVLTVKKKIL